MKIWNWRAAYGHQTRRSKAAGVSTVKIFEGKKFCEAAMLSMPLLLLLGQVEAGRQVRVLSDVVVVIV